MATQKRILILEDEPSLLNILETKYSDAGFAVRTARTVAEAKRQTDGWAPDLTLIDILLPGENGLEFLAWMRDNKEFSKTKKAIITNYPEDDFRDRAHELGADLYCIKTDQTMRELMDMTCSLINHTSGKS